MSITGYLGHLGRASVCRRLSRKGSYDSRAETPSVQRHPGSAKSIGSCAQRQEILKAMLKAENGEG